MSKRNSGSLRFADDTITKDVSYKQSPAKRSRMSRPTNDDDDDEWEASDDEDDEHARAIHQAHLKRRYRDIDDGDDNDNDKDNAMTSLAAEGIAIEPFHMKQEQNDGTGFFDGDTYVFRRDNKEETDAWLDSLPESSSATTTVRSNKRIAARDDASDNMDQIEPTQLYANMIPLVSESETVLKAIARYGNSMKRTPKGDCNTMAHDALNTLTTASNSLLLRGQVDIYEMTVQDLINLMPPEKIPADTLAFDHTKDFQWEYEGRHDGKIHGPFTTSDMLAWIQAGYFVGESAVNVRTVTKKKIPKSMHDDLMDDLMGDDDDQNASVEYERGKWVSSDQINFERYKE